MSYAQQHVLATAIVFAIIVVCSMHLFLFPTYTSNPAPRHVKLASYEQALCHSAISLSVKHDRKVSCPRYGIVSVSQAGRLGNQIWEYASVWGVARRTGLEPYMPRCILKTLKEVFDNLSIPPISNIDKCAIDVGSIVNSLTNWNSTHQNIILPKYSALASVVLTWLDDLRREFVFKKALRRHAEATLRETATQFNLSNPIFVGVHVRRTDYSNFLWQKIRAKPAPAEYYLSAMGHFDHKYDRVVFLVASDDIEWCRNNLIPNRYSTKFVSDYDSKGVGKDLALLSACNHSIIDYGTYGSFGAIMSGGETVVYNVTGQLSTNIAEILPNWKIMN